MVRINRIRFFEKSGLGIDPDNLDFFKSLIIWVAFIAMVILFIFFNVLWKYI